MKGLWVPISGAIAQQKKAETIANNVANANTAGFKKDRLAFKEHLTVLQKGYQDINMPNKEWKPEDFYHSYGNENAKVEISGQFTDFEQGQLTPTGNPLDLAITGQGMFEILTPAGARFTRNGLFTLSPDGYIVANDGSYLLSKISDTQRNSENPPTLDSRKIKISPGQLSINQQGELFLNDAKLTDIGLTHFKDMNALKKEGNSRFVNIHKENLLADSAATSSINQGYVEGSNVNVMQEMTELIKANRNLEAIQRGIKSYDTISRRGINEIAKF